MHSSRSKWKNTMLIIWTVTAKDIVDGFKNKNILTLLLTVLPLIFLYRYGTSIVSSSKPQTLYLYAANGSALVSRLEDSRLFRLRTSTDLPEMQTALTSANLPNLGLAISQEAEAAIQAGREVTLQGYRLYWMTSKQTQQQRQAMEAQFSSLLGLPVSIQVAAEPVYFQSDSGGLGVTAALSLIIVVTMTGMLMVPFLMLEEKQTRTLDALMVSPASPGHIVAGKALAGLFYCLLVIAITLAAYWTVLQHGWLTLLAALLGAVFAVSLGLLMGIYIEDSAQLMLVGIFCMAPLHLPVFLSLLEGAVPPILVTISRLVPSTVILNLARMSFAHQISFTTALAGLGYLLVWSLGLLAIVSWLVHRQDRQEDGIGLSWIRKIFSRSNPYQESQPRASSPPQSVQQASISPEPTPSHTMKPTSTPPILPAPLRAIFAITAKDLVELIHSKAAISILMGTALLLLSSTAMPLIERAVAKPTAVVFDPGRSQLLESLSSDPEIRIILVDSKKAMQAAITEAVLPQLGLVLPADFDSQVSEGSIIALQGYQANWARSKQIELLVERFAARLSQSSGVTVNIQTSGNILFPSSNAGGQPLTISLLVCVILLIIGAVSVPLLFIQEKEAQTLQALLVSPASFAHILAGKALAGIVSCLVAASVIFVFYINRFANPGMMLTSALLGGLFAVSVGLLVGLVSNNPTNSGMWGSLILVAIFGLSGLQSLKVAWPAWVAALLPWLPGSALLNMLRLSMTDRIPLQVLIPSAVSLLTAAALFLTASGWFMRRIDR